MHEREPAETGPLIPWGVWPDAAIRHGALQHEEITFKTNSIPILYEPLMPYIVRAEYFSFENANRYVFTTLDEETKKVHSEYHLSFRKNYENPQLMVLDIEGTGQGNQGDMESVNFQLNNGLQIPSEREVHNFRQLISDFHEAVGQMWHDRMKSK